MGIDNSLGRPGGSGGIAHRRRGIFIKVFRKIIRWGSFSKKFFIAQGMGQGHLGQLILIGQDHKFLNGSELIRHRGQQGNQIFIDKDYFIFGVVDHVNQLIGEEPQIDGMQYRPAAGYSKIELKMAVIVPGKRTNPIAGLDIQQLEDICQPADPFIELSVSNPVILIKAARKNLLFMEKFFRPIQHGRY